MLWKKIFFFEMSIFILQAQVEGLELKFHLRTCLVAEVWKNPEVSLSKVWLLISLWETGMNLRSYASDFCLLSFPFTSLGKWWGSVLSFIAFLYSCKMFLVLSTSQKIIWRRNMLEESDNIRLPLWSKLREFAKCPHTEGK